MSDEQACDSLRSLHLQGPRLSSPSPFFLPHLSVGSLGIAGTPLRCWRSSLLLAVLLGGLLPYRASAQPDTTPLMLPPSTSLVAGLAPASSSSCCLVGASACTEKWGG